MTAWQLVTAMKTRGLSASETADDFTLPVEAVLEAVRYCGEHADLLALEADEEKRRLIEKGYRLEPPPLSR